jgi:hypothetical protein
LRWKTKGSRPQAPRRCKEALAFPASNQADRFDS